ncbi:hypothetical protein LUZ60_010641 [Juncus effusus]|nr:hypothetical protein LUZ60_010641 [Juncus effusus]
MMKWLLLHLTPLLLLFISLFSLTASRDTITLNSSLSDGETLISSNGVFTLGFFTPGNSNYRYLGIWYTQITQQTFVWVANRDDPISVKTGVLSVSTNGSNLLLQDQSSKALWYANSSSNMVNPFAQLQDTGNFVLMESGTNTTTWQSFDYPTDTLLPGMKLGWVTGENRYLSSWSGSDDPSSNNYTFKLDLNGSPEFFIYNGLKRVYRNGPWDGVQFSGEPEMDSTDNTFTFEFVTTQNETYYRFYVNDNSIVSRFVLNQSYIQRYVSVGSGWNLYWAIPRDQCDNYAQCGPYGICSANNSNLPNCTCLTGFDPQSLQDWDLRDTSGGCTRRVGLNCSGDGFIPVNGVKLPDTTNATVDTTIGLDECKKRCLMNCSCLAYANSNVSNGGSGCVMWASELIDMRQFSGNGQVLYYRVAGSEVPVTNEEDTSKKKKNDTAIIVTCVLLGLLILGFLAYLIRKRIGKKYENFTNAQRQRQTSFDSVRPLAQVQDKALEERNNEGNDLSLPLFDINIITKATNDFSLSNKLGEGGFGTVYKGELEGGVSIAVKRLAKFSTQGVDEFKNEVILIAKLQHVNLVRLLGCCIEGEERMLVYEYMENKSLDTIIFDKSRSGQLDWHKRFEIIIGVARGMLYLHQDSRLRVIHRDLKASNILLDKNMNPKISDFGVARIFGGNEKDSYTNRVVGTYGYMSPEYAMDGIFSVKSDVFSFGVLILEIVSGKKNRGIFSVEPLLNLLSYAWNLWKDGKAMELLDTSISMNSNQNSEIIRCIQVGLLCVQDRPEDRPHMSVAILLLSSPNAILPQPKQPGYFSEKSGSDMEWSSSCTVYDTTVTVVEPR